MQLLAYVLVPLAVLAAVVKNAELIAEVFWRITSFFFQKLTKRYAAAAVENKVSSFLNRKLAHQIPSLRQMDIAVNWVTAQDEKPDVDQGKIVVRLRKERNQTRNILNTLKAVLPLHLFPYVRPYLDRGYCTAVDLQILSALSKALGGDADSIFSSDYLGPALETDGVSDSYATLDSISAAGLLDAVLLQELMYLSNRFRRGAPKTAVLQASVFELTDFCRWLANREHGDESRPLKLVHGYLSLGVILTAKSQTAALGTGPYLRRAEIYLAQGVESFYLIGLSADQRPFVSEIDDEMSLREEFSREKYVIAERQKDGRKESIPIVHFRRNELAVPHIDFKALVDRSGIQIGESITGTVVSIDDSGKVWMDSGGARVVVPALEIAWGSGGKVFVEFSKGDVVSAQVLEIDSVEAKIISSIKRRHIAPWDSAVEKSKKCEFSIKKFLDDYAVAKIEAVEDVDEIGESWFGLVPREIYEALIPIINKVDDLPHWGAEDASGVIAGIVKKVSSTENLILLEPSVSSEELWESFVEKCSKDKVIRGTVVLIEPHGVRVLISDGIVGWLEANELQKAGAELAEFRDTVVEGQKLDVYIKGVKRKRRHIQLALERNR